MEKSNEPSLYQVSKLAKKDLENIFEYSFYKFGVLQAYRYIDSFETMFSKLSLNPQLGRRRSEISNDIYSFVNKSHVVFYTLSKNRILIQRILHHKQNYVAYFE